jgi:hypothetical protein
LPLFQANAPPPSSNTAPTATRTILRLLFMAGAL